MWDIVVQATRSLRHRHGKVGGYDDRGSLMKVFNSVVAAQRAKGAAASLVTWCEGKLLVTELDPSVPAQDLVESMLNPKPRWRLVAYDKRCDRNIVGWNGY